MAGRPSKYTEALADQICLRIAEGESLRKVCLAIKVDRCNVLDWLEAKPDFAAKYARARARQADHYFDELIELSKQAHDLRDAPAIKVRVDTVKWVLSKLTPKKYGERPSSQVN